MMSVSDTEALMQEQVIARDCSGKVCMLSQILPRLSGP